MADVAAICTYGRENVVCILPGPCKHLRTKLCQQILISWPLSLTKDKYKVMCERQKLYETN